MPNHVSHRVVVTGPRDQIAAFRARCIVPEDDHEITFDFNTLIPQPASLKDTESGSSSDFGLSMLGIACSSFYVQKRAPEVLRAEFDALSPERQEGIVKATLKGVEALLRTGYADWYQWAIANWETKWNAYSFCLLDATEDGMEFTFQTAWNTPTPIFRKAAEEFPSLLFLVECFDEGWRFAMSGQFGPEGQETYRPVPCEPAIYERIYGEEPEFAPEEEEASAN